MNKILIALDYDPSAQQIAEKGYQLAKSMNAEIVLLHVVSEAFYYYTQDYSPIMGYTGFNNLDSLQLSNMEELKKAAQDYLSTIKQHLGDTTIQTIVKEGDFADVILDTAKELKTDIIAMGSHGRRGLDKILLGSVAERVLHKTDIPLFVIPTRLFKEENNK